jgi:hypothetical protein
VGKALLPGKLVAAHVSEDRSHDPTVYPLAIDPQL